MSVLITILITVVSIVIGMFLGHNIPSKKDQPSPKIIVRSASQIAYALAKIQEGSEKCSEEDKYALINILIELLDEQNHPDTDILYYVASEVAKKSNQIYEIWLTLAYRRIAINQNGRLPEAWFVEPIESETTPQLDLSDISETSTEDDFENEAGPLISPILSKPAFDDDLNKARIYTAQSNLVDLDISLPAEAGLPQHLDMSAVD